jgi:hypothetical protein
MTLPYGFQGLELQASTGPDGFALQNGTPTILSWTAPNDGQMHRVLLLAGLNVTSDETGGQVKLTLTQPDGSTRGPTIFSAAQSAGTQGVIQDGLVKAGSTVTLAQSSALTGGAAVVFAELWGS